MVRHVLCIVTLTLISDSLLFVFRGVIFFPRCHMDVVRRVRKGAIKLALIPDWCFCLIVSPYHSFDPLCPLLVY